MRIDADFARGSRIIDYVVRSGDKVLDLEVKYKLPSRTGDALNRLVAQANASVAAAEGQTVVWTLKEPAIAELRLVTAELGGTASNVQFVHGVEGLFSYLRLYFGF